LASRKGSEDSQICLAQKKNALHCFKPPNKQNVEKFSISSTRTKELSVMGSRPTQPYTKHLITQPSACSCCCQQHKNSST